MNLRSALLAATVVALPLAAQAQQPVTGIYVGLGAGANILSSEKVNVPGSLGLAGVAGSGGQLKFETGFVGKGSVGWGFGNGLRLEVEGSYRDNKANHGELPDDRQLPRAAGNTKPAAWSTPSMTSTGCRRGYSPTSAVAWVTGRRSGTDVRAYNSAGGIATTQNEFKGSFAYQGILGVAFPIAALPGLAITTEFDYYGLSGNREYGATATCYTCGANGTSVTHTGTVTSNSNHNYSFLVGVRYNFGVAPPPPPPPVVAPAPAPARSYLVFFDWDKYNLTDRARQIIHEAAVNSTKVAVTKIQVNGYTDTSGTPQYNMGLSIRRANAVAAELVKDGVPKNVIAIQGFGQTHLLVPTADGVREPQNRRVEIILQ